MGHGPRPARIEPWHTVRLASTCCGKTTGSLRGGIESQSTPVPGGVASLWLKSLQCENPVRGGLHRHVDKAW